MKAILAALSPGLRMLANDMVEGMNSYGVHLQGMQKLWGKEMLKKTAQG